MESRFSKPVRLISVLFLVVWAVSPRATADPRPRLGLQLTAGQPSLSLSGQTGTVYSIQYAAGLSPTNLWVDRTLLRSQGASNVWSDPSSPTPGQRFYRAVSVPAPADTNLVFIQPGIFRMGSPTNNALGEPQHMVTITRGFWMGKYEVTQGEYLAVVGSNPSYFRNGLDGTTQGGTGSTITNELLHPVEKVSGDDATNYCALRTQQERAAGLIPANYLYRLPTEAEWEYACGAGTTTAFYLGSRLQSGQANFRGQDEWDASVGWIVNTSGIFLGITTAVGSYAANPWGLYDMIGNVDELCQDWYDGGYGGYPGGSVIDPQGPATASNPRVIRGGSWYNAADFCRSAFRYFAIYSDLVGFRVVLAPGQ